MFSKLWRGLNGVATQRGPCTTHFVLLQERLRIVVCINVNLGQGIVNILVSATIVDTDFEPRQQELETVSLLDFLAKLINRNVAGD